LYRRKATLEVFLVHPGGPFWAKKDLGVWGIPKGAPNEGENEIDAARREFHEETGWTAEGDLMKLGEGEQRRGKTVIVWAMEGDHDPKTLRSNTCLIEWPPRSGKQFEIPEVDRGAWFSLDEARQRILTGQIPFLDRLEKLLPGSE
jgi:predicted NUDIX family NTP pyrophosphohydrolase